MSKAIIKSNATLHPNILKNIEKEIENDLNQKGFCVIGSNFDVYIFDELGTQDEPEFLKKEFILPSPDNIENLKNPIWQNGRFLCPDCKKDLGHIEGMPHIIHCRFCGIKIHR